MKRRRASQGSEHEARAEDGGGAFPNHSSCSNFETKVLSNIQVRSSDLRMDSSSRVFTTLTVWLLGSSICSSFDTTRPHPSLFSWRSVVPQKCAATACPLPPDHGRAPAAGVAADARCRRWRPLLPRRPGPQGTYRCRRVAGAGGDSWPLAVGGMVGNGKMAGIALGELGKVGTTGQGGRGGHAADADLTAYPSPLWTPACMPACLDLSPGRCSCAPKRPRMPASTRAGGWTCTSSWRPGAAAVGLVFFCFFSRRRGLGQGWMW